MGLYIRKSFRSGPIRINVSKSGLGVSAGIKGARIATGPRGTYLHGGRYGLYYRKKLPGSGKKTRDQHPDVAEYEERGGCFTFLMSLFLIGCVLYFSYWLFNNLEVLLGLAASVLISVCLWIFLKYQGRKTLFKYECMLYDAFINSNSSPSNITADALKQAKTTLLRNEKLKERTLQIEFYIYQSILQKILKDQHITQKEAQLFAVVDDVLSISESEKLAAKKEIFMQAYLEAVQDISLTCEEKSKLTNLISGLRIPREAIAEEIQILDEIIRAQTLTRTLAPLEESSVPVRLQRREKAYHVSTGQVLQRIKSKDTITGVEYKVVREGVLVITDKRVFVLGEGSSNIQFCDIADIDVDLDTRNIVISKMQSGRPVFMRCKEPFLTAKIIDWLLGSNSKD